MQVTTIMMKTNDKNFYTQAVVEKNGILISIDIEYHKEGARPSQIKPVIIYFDLTPEEIEEVKDVIKQRNMFSSNDERRFC